MKVRSTMHGNRITVWLPVTRWPVVSVSIVDESMEHLVWAVMHESFSEAVGEGVEPIELTITRLSAALREPDSPVARTGREIPLYYGVTPEGMHQTAPRVSTPSALRHGTRYVAIVRESVADDLRWFEFTAGEDEEVEVMRSAR